ncbi:MAG: DNA starvation/stationary phase protection protein Dps [Polyangiaceae bacterium]|nr:DNA starvation/stationary phase protection protein Dps [Polyangiaceae bacterium]
MMHQTKNDLPENVRAAIVKILDARLADGIDLHGQVKHAHWNVKGPNFIALHELFDSVAEHVACGVDDLAERAVQLGGVADGLLGSVVKRSSLKSPSVDLPDGRAHVEAVSLSLAAYGAKVRAAIDEADKLGDKDTADLFTEVSRAVDKDLWFVEAHLR